MTTTRTNNRNVLRSYINDLENYRLSHINSWNKLFVAMNEEGYTEQDVYMHIDEYSDMGHYNTAEVIRQKLEEAKRLGVYMDT
jgi:hypothetical protein